MAAAPKAPDGATLGLFAVAVVLGASNFLAVRVSNFDLPPFWGAGLRFVLASLAFVLLAAVLRVELPRRAHAPLLVVFGVLNFGGFYAFMYWALVHVTASVATIVLATVPLATVLLAAAQRLEGLRFRSVAGGTIAVAGIAWITLEPGRVELPLAPLLAMVAAVLCASQSFIIAKRLHHTHQAAVNAIGMAVGGAVLLLLSLLVGEAWFLPRERAVAWALVYLVTFGSVGLFLAALTVVRRWTASATSYMFVLFPITTPLLEAALLGEPITLTIVVGAVVVVAGVWVGALSPAARASQPVRAPR